MDFRLLLPLEDDDGPEQTAREQADHGVPLPSFDPIPSPVVRRFSKLKLLPYDVKVVDLCSNIIAMPHNAARLEISEMWSDVLCSLRSRPADGFSESDARGLAAWWSGFARFALTTSEVDELLLDAATEDFIADYDLEAREVAKDLKAFRERNRVGPEMACRAMGKAVDGFKRAPSGDAVRAVVDAWRHVSETLSGLYAHAESILTKITKWRHGDEATHAGIERRMAAVYLDPARWGNDGAKCGEMVVILTRWMGSEDEMRVWLERTLGANDKKCIEKWLDAYCETRLKIVGEFHHAWISNTPAGQRAGQKIWD